MSELEHILAKLTPTEREFVEDALIHAWTEGHKAGLRDSKIIKEALPPTTLSNPHIITLGLPTRILNALKCADIRLVSDLTEKTERDLLVIPRLGPDLVAKIVATLNDAGFQLSTDS